MKKIMMFGLMIFMICVLCSCGSTLPVIGIVQITTHDSLDTIRNACVKELENLGFADKETCKIIYANANNDTSALSEIMATMKSKNCDVVVAITTPVAVSSLSIADEIPVVFSAVSSPEKILSASRNITGTSDAIQVDLILDYAIEMGKLNDASISKIGFIYNPSEDNSVNNLAKINEYLKDKNIQLIPKTLDKSSDMQSVASTLVTMVDMIFVTDDNTVANVMPVLSNICRENKVPLYAGADSMVKDGGLMTIGINYEDLGTETGKMVSSILNGTNPSDIPVKVFNENLNLYINTKTLEILGYKVKEYDGKIVYMED